MRNILYLSLALLLLSGKCSKGNQNPIPYVPFDINIDISLPSYNQLQGVGGWSYVVGGSKGIIVYRRGIDEFVAFDRHSPVDLEGTCFLPLFPDNDNFLVLKDTCNNATFSLYDGSPISNSAFGLRQYAVQFNGSNIVRIYN